jgi:4-amino-4-deoxy-L-arabinose transferase-like glycosyltransferase
VEGRVKLKKLDPRTAIQLDPRYRRVVLAGVGAGLLALTILLHVYRLSAVPGWDPQEGYNLDIAWNLVHGRLRLFSLSAAFGQHPPLFYLQLAASIHLFGYNITAVRALVALYAVVIDVVLVLVGRRLVGTPAALWAMAIFSAAPVILANTRWGYSYIQLALVGLLCLGALVQYKQGGYQLRWLLVAAALAGIAAFSDYEGIAWVIVVGLVALWPPRRTWREVAVTLAIGLGIPIAGLLICLAFAPGLVIADVGTTLARTSGGNPVSQFILLLLNYAQFLSADPWLLLGVVGLFLVPARSRGLLLGTAAMLGLVVLKVRVVGLSLHILVPLLPLLALGAGTILDRGLGYLYGWLLGWLTTLVGSRHEALSRMAATVIVFVVLVSPVALVGVTDLAGLETNSFTTRQDAILGSPTDAQAVESYVFSHAHKGDLILASPEVAWIFDSPDRAPTTEGADILQTLAQGGQGIAFYPADIPSWRWAYSVSLSRARYVIVDNLIRQLAMPGQSMAVASLLKTAESWRMVFSSGQYAVYEQPSMAALPSPPAP